MNPLLDRVSAAKTGQEVCFGIVAHHLLLHLVNVLIS